MGNTVKGVIIGQLLTSIVGFGALFDLYSANFLMKHFWAVLLGLFGLAFTIAESLAHLERHVVYYASRRVAWPAWQLFMLLRCFIREVKNV